MNKVRRLPSNRVRKMSSGKEPSDHDPLSLVKRFLAQRGFVPDDCLEQMNSEIVTWSVKLREEEELEVTLEGLHNSVETTIYMGVNVLPVPLKGLTDVLVAALTVADTLIGAKLSLVNYDLVISITLYLSNLTIDDLDYNYELLFKQKAGLLESISQELQKFS